MSVWWHHNLSLERKSQTCAFVFEHRSKFTHTLLQTGEFYCGSLARFFGNIRFRERWDPTYAKKTLLPRSDGPPSSSELGEYPTYIIRLSRIFYGKCITNQPFSKFCPS